MMIRGLPVDEGSIHEAIIRLMRGDVAETIIQLSRIHPELDRLPPALARHFAGTSHEIDVREEPDHFTVRSAA